MQEIENERRVQAQAEERPSREHTALSLRTCSPAPLGQVELGEALEFARGPREFSGSDVWLNGGGGGGEGTIIMKQREGPDE